MSDFTKSMKIKIKHSSILNFLLKSFKILEFFNFFYPVSWKNKRQFNAREINQLCHLGRDDFNLENSNESQVSRSNS